tara:strand:+ start:278 stop:625 length:348 start_codon:yes stop_codon:yes gene_type:complete
MNKWIEARCNISNKYNYDYAYLDDWEYFNWSFRILSEKEKQYTEYDSYVNILRIKTNTRTSKKTLFKVLRDYFERSCSCQHDCCGCFFGGLVNLKKPTNRKNNEYIATVSYSPNY